MAKKKYNVKNLSFPILPGASVYFVIDDEKIDVDKATSVGTYR